MDKPGTAAQSTTRSDWDVDRILTMQRPALYAALLLEPFLRGRDGGSEALHDLDQARAAVRSLPEPEYERLDRLRRTREAEAIKRAAAEREVRKRTKEAAQEAARFYNQPAAKANYGYWLKLDYWTLDESVALLLGRNPEVVSWDRVRRETEPSTLLPDARRPETPFLRAFRELRSIAQRADAMRGGELRPALVIEWAMTRAGIQLPPELLAYLEHRSRPSEPAPAPAEAASPPGGLIHNIGEAERRDLLSPAIEEAQRRCGKPYDTPAVWAELLIMAEEKVPPLRGATEEGIQYLKDGQAESLPKEALRKRLKRAQTRAAGTAANRR